MTEKFDEFLEEVQQDIRQEKLQNLWKKYGKIIVGSIVGFFLAVGGYNLWSHMDAKNRTALAEKFMAAQDYMAAGETEKALAELATFSSVSNKTYQQLALFEKAGILLKTKPSPKVDEALAVYTELSANSSVDALWRDFATLLGCMVRMDQPKPNFDEVITMLTPLTDELNAWRFFAKEMKGVALYKKGDSTQAAALFANLMQDKNTPSGIKSRSSLMATVLSTELG